MTATIAFAVLAEPIPGCHCSECVALAIQAAEPEPSQPHPDTRAGELTEMA